MPELFTPNAVKTPEKKERSDTLSHDHNQQDVGFFSALCEYPRGISIEDQEADEHIILLIRRHLITNLLWIITTVVLLTLPLIIPLLYDFIPFELPAFSDQFYFVGGIFYYLAVFGYAFVNFVHWFYNIGLVTEKRVFDIDLLNLMYKHVATATITDIVDVSYVQKGFFSNLFEFADVTMQTEGIKPNFEFYSAPKPSRIVAIMSPYIGEES